MTMNTLQMQSCAHDNGTIECALIPVTLPAPREHEVTIAVDASPINPSDLGLMIGGADLSTARASTVDGQPSVVLDLPPGAQRMMASRIGEWIPAGIEACGRVVAAGDSPEAQALLGRRVGAYAGAMYASHANVPVFQCMALSDAVAPEQGASCFVNPMTALGFVETMRMEGHSAIVHTAAASNLGQMLNRICLAEGIPLVNIVRSDAQELLLREQGATHILNSTRDDFFQQLCAAIVETGATLGFDAIGGGALTNTILSAMEVAAAQRMTEWSRYGSDEHKQVYIYGMLDVAPTTLTRSYGFSWGIGGWLLTPFMKRAGLERLIAMQQRVQAELTTTFASDYSDFVSLETALQPEMVQRYGVRKTGQKTLITFEHA